MPARGEDRSYRISNGSGMKRFLIFRLAAFQWTGVLSSVQALIPAKGSIIRCQLRVTAATWKYAYHVSCCAIHIYTEVVAHRKKKAITNCTKTSAPQKYKSLTIENNPLTLSPIKTTSEDIPCTINGVFSHLSMYQWRCGLTTIKMVSRIFQDSCIGITYPH